MANLGVKKPEMKKPNPEDLEIEMEDVELQTPPEFNVNSEEERIEQEEHEENLIRNVEEKTNITRSEVAKQTVVEKTDKLHESNAKLKNHGAIEDAILKLKNKIRKPKKVKQTTIPVVRDSLAINVETIMEEGLNEAFQQLTPVQRQEFKIKGEETALQIRDLLRSTHVKVKQIFRLLMDWLKMLPGINRFFLEQEAKIKADKILSLKRNKAEKH